MSYRELERLSGRFAGHLQSLGLQPGTRIGLMMPNVLQYPICQLGALRAGCVVVNINPMYTPRELEHQLRDAGAEVVVILENFAHSLSKVIGRTPVKHVLVTAAADLMPLHMQWLAKAVMKAKGLIPPYQLPGHKKLKVVLNNANGARLKPVDVKPGDLAFLQYTGGTTGVSKGAMLTHLNVLANSRQAHVWTEPFFDLTQAQIAITALPMYHIFAMGVAINILGLGGTSVLVADARSTKAFGKVLSK